MGFAYGTPISRYTSLEEAGAATITKHSHYYYADAPGWLLRAEAVSYSYAVDADREEYGSTAPAIELWAFPVDRFTPLGATLQNIWSGARKRWVDLRPGKQWASRTAEEAVQQLADRRKRQLYILARQTRRAEFEVELAQRALARNANHVEGPIA